jgi:hypothetical protein
MTVTYRDQTLPAEVAADGRFIVRRLPVFQDYTVEIKADGFRAFRSHNSGFNIPNPNNQASPPMSSSQTFYYDAYLFPTSLATEAIELTFRKGSTTGELATGKARIRPSTPPSLADDSTDTPVAVGRQLWTNDEDLQAKSLNKDVVDGKLDIAPGELVYGVTYVISVYEVAGYQPLDVTITAGVNGSQTYAMSDELTDPLTLTASNYATCRTASSPNDVSDSIVTFTFNTPIELSTSTYPGGAVELIDDGITITTNHIAADGGIDTLAADLSPTVQERGTSLSVAGNTLTLSWNPSVGLAVKNIGDPITSVRYSISGLNIQPIGKPTQSKALSTYAGATTTIVCSAP